jgi:hypothetical protein
MPRVSLILNILVFLVRMACELRHAVGTRVFHEDSSIFESRDLYR